MLKIPASYLERLVLQHHSSAIDSAAHDAMTAVTGFSRWATETGELHVQIAWRWAELRATIVILDPQRIQANFLLVGASGREEPRLRALIQLVNYVETLPWRVPVRQLLLSTKH